MSGKTVTKAIPALGRPFKLGMLYDVRKDELVPGLTLWNNKTIETAINNQLQSEKSSICDIIAEDRFEDKANALDINASLKLSFMGGLIEVGGSARYLTDRKSSNHHARVTLKYSATTSFEHLSMELLGRGNAEYQDAFEHDIATHVVTGIMYGGQAFFVFDGEVSESENFKKVNGQLHGMVKALQIEGNATGKLDKQEKKKVDKFSCTFYGDFVPNKNPTSYEDAVLLYRDLPKLMLGENGENARAVKVWLYPLEYLDSNTTKMVREISVNLVNQVETVLEELHQYNVRCNDLMKEDVCRFFPRIKDQVFHFQKMVAEFKISFQQRLMPLLPNIRGCGAKESDLADILKGNEESPFCCHKLSMWLNEKEREIKVLRAYVEMFKDVQFAYNPGDLDSAIGDPAIHIVACYTFKLSGKFDHTLAKLATFLGKPNHDEDDTLPLDPWYAISEVTQNMMKSARMFHDFANANKEDTSIKMIVADQVLGSDSQFTRGACIVLYKDSVVIDEDFEPPSSPISPSVQNIGHDSITMQWGTPEFGAENIKNYEVLYKIVDDSGDTWMSVIANEAPFVLSDLKLATAYQLKVRAMSIAGKSNLSEVYDDHAVTITLPTSPPSIHVGKDVEDTNLTLVWFKPLAIGGKVEINHYRVAKRKIRSKTSSTESSDKWINIRTTGPVESIYISGLTPETTYQFHVVAVCGEAGCSAQSDLSGEITTTPVNADKMLSPNSYPSPKVVVIGVTGAGKSTLCNALAGKDPNGRDSDGFPVSAEPSSCTNTTTMRVCNWLGTGDQFTIIDTPGLDDPSGTDTANLAAMAEELKKIKFVNAFLIVFNGQNPRLDRSLKAMLQIFKGMFGPRYLHNTIIEFSRWSFDGRAKAMRQKDGPTEESQNRDWNKKFREELGTNADLPMFFVDARYLEADTGEADAFKEQTSELWQIINKLEPYECKDFEAVMAEHDRLIKEVQEADKKREISEGQREEADAAAEKARLAKEKAEREGAEAEGRKEDAEAATEEARLAKTKAEKERTEADLGRLDAEKNERSARAAGEKAEQEKRDAVLRAGAEKNRRSPDLTRK